MERVDFRYCRKLLTAVSGLEFLVDDSLPDTATSPSSSRATIDDAIGV